MGQMSVRALLMRAPVFWYSANPTFCRFRDRRLADPKAVVWYIGPVGRSADGAGDGELDDAVVVVAEHFPQDVIVVLAQAGA